MFRLFHNLQRIQRDRWRRYNGVAGVWVRIARSLSSQDAVSLTNIVSGIPEARHVAFAYSQSKNKCWVVSSAAQQRLQVESLLICLYRSISPVAMAPDRSFQQKCCSLGAVLIFQSSCFSVTFPGGGEVHQCLAGALQASRLISLCTFHLWYNANQSDHLLQCCKV